MLFHGTSSEFVEAICIHNFDWRINGIHGALFGKGTHPNLVGVLGDRLLFERGLMMIQGLERH